MAWTDLIPNKIRTAGWGVLPVIAVFRELQANAPFRELQANAAFRELQASAAFRELQANAAFQELQARGHTPARLLGTSAGSWTGFPPGASSWFFQITASVRSETPSLP